MTEMRSVATAEEFHSGSLDNIPVGSLHGWAIAYVEDLGVHVLCIQRRNHQLDDPVFIAILLVTGDNESKIASAAVVGIQSLDVVYSISVRYRDQGWENRSYLGSGYASR